MEELRSIFVLGLVLLGTLSGVNADCSLTKSYVEASLCTFLISEPAKDFGLLHSTEVKDGTTLNLQCSKEPKEHTVHCRGRNLDPKDPVRQESPTNAEVKPINNDQSCPATMYSIGYSLGSRFLELYRACYDKKNVRAFFSEATVYWKNIYPKRLDWMFTTDGLITQAEASSFSRGNIYNNFVKIYGRNQKYIAKGADGRGEMKINRGHLVASADMMFMDQMYNTFKYVNVVPQFGSINDGNWEKIEKWVRASIPRGSSLIVRSGAVGILSLATDTGHTKKSAYLMYEQSKNPIPEWMYKMVRNAEHKLLHVFLTYNNIYENVKPTPHNSCKPITCPSSLSLEDNAQAGFTFCCEPEEFAQHISHYEGRLISP